MSIEVVVPDEPVAMPRPRVMLRGGKPHAYVPTHASAAMWRIRQAAADALGERAPLLTALTVEIEAVVHPPVSIPKKAIGQILPIKRPDLDNYIKTALDGCSVLWKDDAQVVEIRATKRYGWNESPHWRITINEMSE